MSDSDRGLFFSFGKISPFCVTNPVFDSEASVLPSTFYPRTWLATVRTKVDTRVFFARERETPSRREGQRSDVRNCSLTPADVLPPSFWGNPTYRWKERSSGDRSSKGFAGPFL